MFKKIIAFFVSVFQMIGFGVSYGENDMTSEPIIKNTEIINDIDGDTALAGSIKYAASVNNIVDAYYTDTERTIYSVQNADMKFVHMLLKNDNGATLSDNEGNVYIADSFDTYYINASGEKFFSRNSVSDGRVNTIRLGEYYYECHVRDLDFGSDVFKVDKAYHVYGDRLYTQLSLLASEATADLAEFGSIVSIPKDTVAKLEIRDENGSHSDCNSVDNTSVEYIAFDIKDVGVVGFIIPSDGSTSSVTIDDSGDYYTVCQTANYKSGTGINKYDETGGYELNSVTFGCRIWTDKTHSFEQIAKAAELERNPLDGITVNGGNAEGKYIGYDSLRGAYTFEMQGTDFNNAYQNPDLQYSLPISITCDSFDREIYIRANGDNGCLEAAAVLDDTDTLVPINVQVCKNFSGDGGEPFYSAADHQYGDSFFPISLKANETIDFTLLNLYQNWGNYPLKQMSSIEFHVSYYHLSTGTTESNCIAPYFVFGKDGWTLPDFRTRSGEMWAEQPQFNSVGVLKFMTYRQKALGLFKVKDIYSEYKDADIASVGQTYSDITNEFVSDCGSYTYSLRHVEFPQTDDNRTYYTLEVNFNKDITFSNFRRDFDLFYFDGRFVKFNNANYLDENNRPATVEVNTMLPEYYTLGNDNPYWGFYSVTDDTKDQIEQHFGANFAMIINDSSIIMSGKEQNIPFVFRDSSNKDVSVGALTLDEKKISFSAGDSIKIDLVLLPWGNGLEDNDQRVLDVREDSAVKPVTATAVTGTVENDNIVPTFSCENNVAEFTLTGGRNNIAVRVNGFTSLKCPDIYLKTDNGWEEVDLASVNGYDGYSVYYNDDGTYGFSFIYTAEAPDSEYTFKVEQ